MTNPIEDIGVTLGLDFNEKEKTFINKAIRRILVEDWAYLCEDEDIDILDNFRWSMTVEFERTVRECVDMTTSKEKLRAS